MTNANYIPAGYNAVIPYLIIRNAAGFIEFAKAVFSATEASRHMRDEHTIMHAEIRIEDSVIMLADATEEYPPSPAGMFVYVRNADESFASAIANGATQVMPLTDQPYGRTCGVTDPSGNTWWITSQAQ